MNDAYRLFIEGAKLIAANHGLDWNPRLDPETGKIQKKPVDVRWNITALRNERGTAQRLSTFGVYGKYLTDDELASGRVLSPEWQDFLKAAVLDQAIRKQKKGIHAVQNIGTPIRILGSFAGTTPPWELNADIVRSAYNRTLQFSPKGAMNLEMTIRTVIDVEGLSDAVPLAPYCKEDSSKESQKAAAKVAAIKTKANRHSQIFERSKLTDRKNAEKLPEARAFWELVRILFTENPKYYTDAITFEMAKIALFAGARSSEITSLPVDCLTYRDIPRKEGIKKTARYGFDQALYLQNFAAKQQGNTTKSQTVLVQRAMAVPVIQEDIIKSAVERIKYLTEPLRRTVRQQRASDRMLPQYEPEQMIQLAELHPIISGSLWFLDIDPPSRLVDRYRKTWSHEDRQALIQVRNSIVAGLDLGVAVRAKLTSLWGLFQRQGLNIETCGNPVASLASKVRIGDLEDFLKSSAPTKQSDLTSYSIDDGSSLHPENNLVLLPKRAIIENRQNGILDVDAYASVGILNTQDLLYWMRLPSGSSKTVFESYGETEEDRKLGLGTHSFRHLKTTELLRNGVTNTAIATHQNRRDPSQNQDYDHRSLLEDLEDIDIPDEALVRLPDKAQTTLRLIMTGRARGPIVDKFIEIREASGEPEAFDFLAAEADGFHVTPWGYCLKNFWISSCPKHLQCTKNCGHYARSDNPAHDTHLRKVKSRTEVALKKLRAKPKQSPGYANQVVHAEELIAGIDAALATQPGQRVFPDGDDLFESTSTPSSVLDTGDRSMPNLDMFDE